MQANDIIRVIETQQAAGVTTSVADLPRSWLEEHPALEIKSAAPQTDAPQPVHSNDSVEALYAEILAFDGCDLKEMAINTVIADGNPAADLMLIGEAPGADEDRSGKPFVGKSGKLLDRMFEAIGLNRAEDYLVTNTVFWRPPGNRKPNGEEVELCLPFTRRHIELVRPKVLVFVGGLSAQSLLAQNQGILRLRGKWLNYRLADGTEIPALPILHPAYLLSQPRHKRETWMDLLSLKAKLDATRLN